MPLGVSWLGTTPPECLFERYTTASRSVQRLPRLAQNRYQDSAYLAVGLHASDRILLQEIRFKIAKIAFLGGWYKFETP